MLKHIVNNRDFVKKKKSHYRSNQDWRKSLERGIVSGNWERIWSPSFVLLTHLTFFSPLPVFSPKILQIPCSDFFFFLISFTQPNPPFIYKSSPLGRLPKVIPMHSLIFQQNPLNILFSPLLTLASLQFGNDRFWLMMDTLYLPYHIP